MSPSNNARVLTESIVKEDNQRAPHLTINKFFEFFVASQVLKDLGLNDEEVFSGIPESSRFRDGGIDGVYLFSNHKFIQSGSDPDIDKSITNLDLHFIQCKYTDNVPEEVIHKLVISMGDLLDLSNNLNSSELQNRYSPEIIETINTFRELYRESRSGVKICFNFYIAHLAGSLSPNLTGKTNHLVKAVKDNVSEAITEIKFLGPQDLIDLVRHEPKTEFLLKYTRDIISPDEKGFACLVNLLEFYKFIHDEDKNTIRESIFEANVRDYQGDNPVNEAIRNSLGESFTAVDFWWLNNGVTMVAEKVTRRGDGLIIENPEIVNGLQTSHTINAYFSNNLVDSEKRHILIRIIELNENDDQTRDMIIRATNSQTPIPPLLLHATETIHYNIEDYLRKCSPPLYYERRKSYYKNKGKKINDLIDMQSLAQAIVAVLIRRPDHARTRIRAFLSGKIGIGQNTKENYSLVFSPDYPYEFYYFCGILRKRTEQFLRSDVFSTDPQKRSHAKYVLHHIMMEVAIILTRNSEGPTINGEDGWRTYAEQISKIKLPSITDEVLKDSAERVLGIFENSKFQALPNAAKGNELVQEIILSAREQLRQNK